MAASSSPTCWNTIIVHSSNNSSATGGCCSSSTVGRNSSKSSSSSSTKGISMVLSFINTSCERSHPLNDRKTLQHRQCRGGVRWSISAGLTQCREELHLLGSCTTPSPPVEDKRPLLRWGTGTPSWSEDAGPGARWARSTPWSKATNRTTRSRRSPW